MSDSQNSTLATSHGDDKMEEDSGSMGLIGEAVGLGDRIQEEQMHTGNKEHSLNSHDPVNHVCERRPNIDTTAEPSVKEPSVKEPSSKVISKSLSRTDVEERLSVPASFLHLFPNHEGGREIEFQAIDTLGKLWTFKLSCRSKGSPKPVITGQWLSFVKDKGVKARAGDTVIFTGTVVVVPDILALASPGERAECRRESSQLKNSAVGGEGVRGLRALGVRDLSYRLAFIANSVQVCDGRRDTDIRNRKKAVDEDDNQEFTTEELDEIQRMRNTPDFFNKIVDSIAPTVFGHQDIKRAILLMLLGGVHKFTHEGINLRGDINVCIVGDPSCAKSQFLKYASGIVPRSVYTSGKSSSAAGLTASVAKEPETGEFCIEAGALMLADNGICCIDEFDKMDIRDQVAIHEAMEQQTISITKAGIQATLNARTSILAAANPAGGRYDKSKPLKYNVALPPAILSRFDLVYVMIDDPDDQTDYHIAHHIVRVHQKREEALSPAFTTAQIKRYITYAKTLKPKLNSEARKLLVDSYVALRKGDTTPGSRVAYRMTVRQLEALIRLSEAIARSHLETQVQPRHVRVAVKLLKTSIISVESSEIDLSEFQEAYGDGGDGGNDGPSQGDAQPSNADANPVSENTENGAASASRQGKKLVISEEYFQRVTQALVMRLRQHEEAVMRDGTGLAGMRQGELIRWYVDQQNQKNSYSSLEEAKNEASKIKAIIESLIRREGFLIVVDDGSRPEAEGDGARQSSSRDDRILVVAPNYLVE